MAKITSRYLTRGFRNAAKVILPADTTAVVTVAAAGADDSIIKAISITSTDSAARNVSLILSDGSTSYVLDTLNIPITAGTDGSTIAVNGLSGAFLPIDSATKKVLPLMQGWTLKAAMLVTITAAKQVTINVVLEDY